MPIERQTARKMRISDVVTSTFVRQEGMEPSYVETALGPVARVRAMATVMNVFRSEDGNFGSLTLDDGTDTIRVKAFKDLKVLNGVGVGDLVDVIGKVREYNGEVYIMPEVIKKVADPNMELLRRAELLRMLGAPRQASMPVSKGVEERADLRRRILEVIESRKEGATFAQISEAVKADDEEIEDVINELLSEGVCYEPTPGRIKKI